MYFEPRCKRTMTEKEDEWMKGRTKDLRKEQGTNVVRSPFSTSVPPSVPSTHFMAYVTQRLYLSAHIEHNDKH